MKLSLLLILLACFKVSASVFAQTITLNEKNAPLAKVFRQIEKQSGYSFFYKNDLLKNSKPVTINISGATLSSALEACFSGQPLVYEVVDNTIIVKAKSKNVVEKVKSFFSKPVKVSGRVTDTAGKALPGASIHIKGSTLTYLTRANGEFSLEAQPGDEITISYIGYKPFVFTVSEGMPFSNVTLYLASSSLDEVVVSTGYQEIPKERATGSFVTLDRNLLNRRVSTNILDRIDGIASGLQFYNSTSKQYLQSNIEVRGRSTLYSNADPLIILDNFPYDGNLSNINPNDVESISVLKDAAAASAWGSRSGNGVIVITTKKGRLNSVASITFNANTTLGGKPDIYYTPQLTPAEYIDIEQFLFRKGAYNTSITRGYVALSPAVQIFADTRSGKITPTDSLARINALKTLDSRKQILEYYYRPLAYQQYQASIGGGSSSQKYYLSAGYDKNLNSNVNNSYDRISINANNTYYFLKNRLELFNNIIYTGSTTKSGPAISSTNYPYEQLADANGNPLAVANTLNINYASTAGGGKLLNWLYKPLEELNNGYGASIARLTDYRISTSLSYKLWQGLKLSALYNYQKGVTESNQLNELESYYTRNLINTYTQINTTTGAITYPVPLGAILNRRLNSIKSQNGRLQLNYDQSWKLHQVNAIAGAEIKDYVSLVSAYTLYGYNPETAANQNAAVNFTALYPYYYRSSLTGRIPTGVSDLGTSTRFLSYYFNGAYNYAQKYIVSFSARRDESNLFGVSTNQKGVPLWSAGLAWNISRENFYHIDALPNLKLRATYGYTGTVNNTISAYLTAIGGNINEMYNAYSTAIVNPPNPSLKWEKNSNLDFGIDFSTAGDRISGSIDYWRKKGEDLIGSSPIAPQTGITLFTGNSAQTLTKGWDIQLTSNNLQGAFKWQTTVLYNYSTSRVTDYKVQNGTNYNVVSANYNNPLQGYPFYAIFSLKYAGLNSSGDPQGYVDGKLSTDYSAIMNSINRSDLEYKGSATPTSFGSVRNTFTYGAFDLSMNIIYKFGYYFRRSSLNDATLYSTGGNNYQMDDYGLRWQQPGDEQHTNVPAPVYPANISRTALYTYSGALVEKADHIRLQDIRLGYTFPKKHYLPFKSLSVYSYINNIGIIWKANKKGIDPDYPTGLPAIRTFAFGMRADL